MGKKHRAKNSRRRPFDKLRALAGQVGHRAKRLRALAIAPALVLFIAGLQGCAGVQGKDMPQLQIQVSDEAKEEATKILIRAGARELAKRVADKKPKIVKPGLDFCDAFFAAKEDDLKPLIDKALRGLNEEFGDDPYIVNDLSDLLALIKINVKDNLPLTPTQIKLINAAVQGFEQGLKFAGQ